jgi:hypothetical protein
MTGDQSDFQSRIRSVLPTDWFPDSAPVLDALLFGLGAAWAQIYSLLQYVKAQTRLATATDVWLDVIAWDFFGESMMRGAGESDSSFRQKIRRSLFREKATRWGVGSALADLTGRAPTIFEPSRPADTGGYSTILSADVGGGVGYGAAGGWGSLQLPFQCFIIAYRPSGGGIAQVAGWGAPGGGYGGGEIEYASLGMVPVQVTDADIYSTIADTLPEATIGWTQIRN